MKTLKDGQYIWASALLPPERVNGDPIDGPKVKFLIYSDDPEMGGVGHHCVAVARAALSLGWDVSLAQPKCDHPLLHELIQAGVQVHWISFNTSQFFSRTIADGHDPMRIIQAANPSLILFADCCHVSNIAAKHVAITRGIPFITVCHSAATYIAQRFANCLPVVKNHFTRAAEIVAVSQMTLNVTWAHYGLSRNRGMVIHSGRPRIFFEPRSAENRQRIRQKLGIPEDATVCLTAARVIADKGYGLLYFAIDQLRKENKLDGLHFIWAGDGAMLPELRAAIQTEKLGAVIHCLGHCSAVQELYDTSDIFVLPTSHESFGLSVAEGMAKGLAVIASKVEGIPEVMGETGIYLPDPKTDPRGVVEALKKSVLRLHQDKELTTKMGRECHERAKAFFTEERMIARFAEMLARVASSTAGGRKPVPVSAA